MLENALEGESEISKPNHAYDENFCSLDS